MDVQQISSLPSGHSPIVKGVKPNVQPHRPAKLAVFCLDEGGPVEVITAEQVER